MSLQPFAQTRSTRWANGTGETRELRGWPTGGEHPWRLSIATISSDQPFSHFTDVDRALMSLSAEGVSLNIAGAVTTLSQYDTVVFAGEDAVVPVGVQSPSLDLNLFVPRSAISPRLTLVTITGRATVDALAAVALDGTLTFQGAALSFGDAVFDNASGDPGPIEIRGNGRIALATC